MSWKTSKRSESLPDNWEAIRRDVFRRDKRRCQIKGKGCRTFATEVDHIGDPGDHRLVNLRAVCSQCHGKRSAQQGHAAQARLRALSKRPPERHPGARRTPGASS